MANYARVESIESLKALRASVLKFIESADRATMEADAEIDHALGWVCRDQSSYWRGQIRRRGEGVRRAKEDLSRKRMSFTASGSPPSTIDEDKALARAHRALDEAEQKARAVKGWALRIEKERTVYKGLTGPIRSLLGSELPRGVRELDGMLTSLEAYLALETPQGGEALSGGRELDRDRENESEDQ